MRIVAQIVASLAIALFKWLEGRHEKAKTAQVAERHADALRRIGDRVRTWEDRARDGRLPIANRTGDDGPGVSPD